MVEQVVRPLAVVLPPPDCQCASYVLQHAEPTCVEALVAQPSLEALYMSVLHRPTRLDVHQPDHPVFGPAQHALRGDAPLD